MVRMIVTASDGLDDEQEKAQLAAPQAPWPLSEQRTVLTRLAALGGQGSERVWSRHDVDR